MCARCARRRGRHRVIVVNHTLLLLDAAMGGFLLPERDVIVIDEAHHLEEEATRAFTVTVTPGRVRSLLAQQRLQQNSDPAVQQRVRERAQRRGTRWRVWGDPMRKGRQRLTQPIGGGPAAGLGALTDLATSLQANASAHAGREGGAALREAGQAHTDAWRRICASSSGRRRQEERVYYVEQIGRAARTQNQPTRASRRRRSR